MGGGAVGPLGVFGWRAGRSVGAVNVLFTSSNVFIAVKVKFIAGGDVGALDKVVLMESSMVALELTLALPPKEEVQSHKIAVSHRKTQCKYKQKNKTGGLAQKLTYSISLTRINHFPLYHFVTLCMRKLYKTTVMEYSVEINESLTPNLMETHTRDVNDEVIVCCYNNNDTYMKGSWLVCRFAAHSLLHLHCRLQVRSTRVRQQATLHRGGDAMLRGKKGKLFQ